jgi:hypothetical protein
VTTGLEQANEGVGSTGFLNSTIKIDYLIRFVQLSLSSQRNYNLDDDDTRGATAGTTSTSHDSVIPVPILRLRRIRAISTNAYAYLMPSSDYTRRGPQVCRRFENEMATGAYTYP